MKCFRREDRQEAHRLVAEHLHDALATGPTGVTDIAVAELHPRTADVADHDAVRMLADEVRTQRDPIS